MKDSSLRRALGARSLNSDFGLDLERAYIAGKDIHRKTRRISDDTYVFLSGE